MTGPVNSASAASAIAALLRRAVSAQLQSAKRTESSEKLRKAAGRTSADKQHGNSPLAEVIAKRAEELDPDASDYRSRLLRLVVEAALLHELGSNLLNAPKFQSMVDQILYELENAPQMKRDVDMVLDRLSRGTWPSV